MKNVLEAERMRMAFSIRSIAQRTHFFAASEIFIFVAVVFELNSALFHVFNLKELYR
jgi:hypothetical protein